MHPDIIRLQFLKGTIMEKTRFTILEIIGIIMYIDPEYLSLEERDFIISDIVRKKDGILKIFDNFRNVEFLNFLIVNIK